MNRRELLKLLVAVPSVLLLPENTAPSALPALAFRKDAFSSIRMVHGFVVTAHEVSRVDVLYGFGTIEPSILCRVLDKPLGARARRRQKRERQAAVLKARPDGMVETSGWSTGNEGSLRLGDIITFRSESYPMTRADVKYVPLVTSDDIDCGDDEDYYDD